MGQVASLHPERLALLNQGYVAAATLTEELAVEFPVLMMEILPEVTVGSLVRLQGEGSITRRMRLAGEILYGAWGLTGLERLQGHPSDTVRGWAAYGVAAAPGLTVAERLERVRIWADDDHFGVREWAWLAVRPWIAADVVAAIEVLQGWTGSPSANLRRFAVESTRPRGVWCRHLEVLKTNPALGLPILEPLKRDPARYVQDAVGNWLHDAAKSQPQFVREVCARWQESRDPATARICRRALRG
ncbi:MAG: HEAT repeat domain-containing protein [Synechococcales cyanobacterium]